MASGTAKSQEPLAAGARSQVGVSFTYISKVENKKPEFWDYSSEDLIRRLASVLEPELDEPPKIVPDRIRKRVLARPDAFLKLAELDDRQLDRLMGKVPKLKQ
jgi:transcriptional regulator with XRE-family HTH domain